MLYFHGWAFRHRCRNFRHSDTVGSWSWCRSRVSEVGGQKCLKSGCRKSRFEFRHLVFVKLTFKKCVSLLEFCPWKPIFFISPESVRLRRKSMSEVGVSVPEVEKKCRAQLCVFYDFIFFVISYYFVRILVATAMFNSLITLDQINTYYD